ncbi:hypothetical protein, partial [Enterococcus faecium]|uniref:hypothetical protein n=1 Tax=Enterococcus faecium TaxID=1352 RepID=UPI00292E6488
CFLAFLENQERQGSPYLDEMVEKYLRAIHSSLAILVQEIWLILELAFKRVLGVLVFATDIETGQRSKVVLSDILQCYLTVGFQ